MEKKLITVDLSALVPYENNPRFNDSAVPAVKESIAQCGYITPIVVDEDMRILAGHTRCKALLSMGGGQVQVLVCRGLTDEQKRKFRLLDNKTGEFADWDFGKLEAELDGLDFGGFDFDWNIEEQQDEKTQEDLEQEFRERMASGELSEDSEEYQEFLQKFEAKKTTDDCYTPENIYAAVRDWAVDEYGLQGRKIIRPFYPGGDYEHEKYPKGCVVIDNPPFSIISEICKFYNDHGIDYFMFGPTLTIMGILSGGCNYVVTGASVTYENGANVNTSFVTNLGEYKAIACPSLRAAIDAENKKNLEKIHKSLPKYKYPDQVLSGTMLSYMATHGVELKIRGEDMHFIRTLDAMKDAGKGIFGSGYLLSEKAAAEKAAAENATAENNESGVPDVWQLSDREWAIVHSLG